MRVFFFFFFKQKTAYEMRISDWSSDVCSSDLLALGDYRRGVGEDAQHVQRAVGNHELERAAEQEVADQHARLVAPHRVGGGKAAAQVAGVDHVVMQQGGGVDELDKGGESGSRTCGERVCTDV